MAAFKGKEIWLIVLLVGLSAVLAVLSFTKDKACPLTASSNDVLADKAAGSAPAAQVAAPAAVAATSVAVSAMPVKSEAVKTSVEAAASAVVRTPSASAPKASSSLVEPLKVTANKPAYAIQVYSFQDKKRAESALAKLKAKNYKGYIMESDLGQRGIWFRVRIGSFATEEEAKSLLDAIKTDFKSGIIVTE